MATIAIPSLLKSFSQYQTNASLVLLLIITIGIITTLKWYTTTPKVIIKNLPPSPPKFPIIGNLHHLISLSPPHRTLKTLSEKYGPLMLLHLGHYTKPLLVVSSPNAASEVLKTHDLAFASRPKTKFPSRLMYDCRDVAFAPYGEYWRQVRSICVLQLLSNKRVQSFRRVVEQEVGCMMNKIRQGCEKTLNFDDVFSTLTYDIVCMVAFGKKYSYGGNYKFKVLFHELTDLLGVFNVGDYIPCLEWINYLNGLEGKVKRVARDFDEYLEHIVQENMDDNRQQEGDNFVQVLLQIQKNDDIGFTVDRDIIKAIVLDMLVAATDTTYTLLQWAMSELICHKDKLLKLQDEVRNITAAASASASAAVITDQEISEMHYLKAVIKETLRLHPPLPLMIPHESQEKVMNLMGYEIDKGTRVMVNIWAIGRDPCSWGEDAHEFKPERFLNSSSNSNSNSSSVDYKYIPFGAGRRSCPGSTFALGNAEFALASLVNGFDFGLPDGFDSIHMDMSESSGITAHRKTPLLLVATLPKVK